MMNLVGYEEIFGAPFWKEAPRHKVHAFIAGADFSEESEKQLLHVEVLSGQSFDAQYRQHRDNPPLLFGSLRTSAAIVELDRTAVREMFGVDRNEALEGTWRTFTVDADGGGMGRTIKMLDSFFDTEGTHFEVVESEPTPPEVVASHLLPLGEAADEEVLKEILSGAALGLEVAVLDVGQGAASFLFDKSARPIPQFYFDLGGGVHPNASTFPKTGVHWCFTQRPPVILSHWHWDHWAGATYGGPANTSKALGARWLAPNQKTGSHTNKFKARIITAGGRIHYWPIGLPHLTVGNITLGKAGGANYNDSGLILLLKSNDGRYSLLPGDAGYGHIPSAISTMHAGGLRTLVISHHGGTHGGVAGIPKPDGIGHNVAIYSAGSGNTYGHPTHLADYSGWPIIVGTHQRHGLPVRHLYADTGGILGHCLMYPPCGSPGTPRCSLTLHM
jgi:hypothetical protein